MLNMKVSIDKIKNNPKNPRVVKNEKFKKLVQSIKEFPQMLEKRPLVCFTDVDNKYVVLGGNMRLKALREVGINEVEINLADDWTEEQKNQFIIKDNISFGEWDWEEITENWNIELIDDWGLEIPKNLKLDDEESFTEDLETPDQGELYSYNEYMLFPYKNKYCIPELKENMIYDGVIDDVLWTHNEEKDENKKYLALYGNMAIDERLAGQIIGFFVDDHRFEVVWNQAVSALYKFDKIKPTALLTPNFSLWADEPKPFQIMAWYKTMWCGRYWQEAGYKIIPTLNWSDESSHEFCFLGLPKKMNSAIIQTRNIKTKSEFANFKKGISYIKENFEIKKFFIYGGENDKIKRELDEFNWQRIRPWNEKKALIDKKTSK